MLECNLHFAIFVENISQIDSAVRCTLVGNRITPLCVDEKLHYCNHSKYYTNETFFEVVANISVICFIRNFIACDYNVSVSISFSRISIVHLLLKAQLTKEAEVQAQKNSSSSGVVDYSCKF